MSPCSSAVMALLLASLLVLAQANPLRGYGYNEVDADLEPNPFVVDILNILSKIRHTSPADEVDNTKRGLDLGLNRGFSGTQAAKHMMGLAAAQFAGGPGRRRRSA